MQNGILYTGQSTSQENVFMIMREIRVYSRIPVGTYLVFIGIYFLPLGLIWAVQSLFDHHELSRNYMDEMSTFGKIIGAVPVLIWPGIVGHFVYSRFLFYSVVTEAEVQSKFLGK